MTAKMISAIERYAAALSALDEEAYVACFAKDAIVGDPYGAPAVEGVIGLREWFRGMTRSWGAFDMTLQESYSSGGRIAVRWEVMATARSGRPASFAGINVFAVNELGQIESLEGYWDLQAMLRQLS